MKLNFKSFIDIDEHSKIIKNDAQEITNKYCVAPQATNLYLDALSDLFIKDIMRVTDVIYENIMLEKSLRNLKFTSNDLIECIRSGAKHFITQYMSILNSYNMGAMFSNHPSLETYTNNFLQRADKILKKRTEISCSKYSEYISNNRYSNKMLVFTVIAAAAAMIAAIPIIKGFFDSLIEYLNIHIV